MDAKNYESTEFYSYKYRNFSTMIIIPAAIFVLLLFVGSFFAVRQNTVSSVGVVEPTVVIKRKNVNYDEGQVVTKYGQKWVAHVDQGGGISLMPVMKPKSKVKILLLNIVYLLFNFQVTKNKYIVRKNIFAII